MSYSRPAYLDSQQGRSAAHDQSRETPSNGNESQPSHDDGLIESTLTRFIQSTDLPGLSQDDEEAFQFELQAAAAAASHESVLANQHSSFHAQDFRQRRLGRACDACSKRKVKCGENVPCKHCVDLGIPCTFSRPKKRRGPLNRMAEEVKRQRLDNDGLLDMQDLSNPDTYLSVDAISSFESIQRLLYNFYTYVYPIFPFPHEHLVLARLQKREDIQNKSFSALIASMVATFSTLFPNAAQKALEYEADHPQVFLEHFIARCMLVCEQARGPLTGEKDVNDAATNFFVALVYCVRKQTAQVPLFLTESLSIVQYLKVETETSPPNNTDPVTQELCKRIFWAVYGLSRSLLQAGEGQDMMPPRRTSQLPALPLPLDDYYIYQDRIQAQPHGQLSMIEGSNLLAQVYASYHGLIKFDVLEDDERNSETTRAQEALGLKFALEAVDSILPNAHPELAAKPTPAVFEPTDIIHSPETRMHIRWEVQKVVLRTAIIKTRYYLVERLANLVGDVDDDVTVFETRKKGLSDLAVLLSHVTKASLEPVGKMVLDDLRRMAKAMKEVKGVREGDPVLLTVHSRVRELFGWETGAI